MLNCTVDPKSNSEYVQADLQAYRALLLRLLALTNLSVKMKNSRKDSTKKNPEQNFFCLKRFARSIHSFKLVYTVISLNHVIELTSKSLIYNLKQLCWLTELSFCISSQLLRSEREQIEVFSTVFPNKT